MPRQKFDSFEEFWPHYLEEHSDPNNRLVHAIVTPVGIASTLAFAIAVTPWAIPLGIVGTYGSLWAFGHAMFQGNKPSTLQNPVYSFLSDFKMVGMMYMGKIEQEYERLGIDHRGPNAQQDFEQAVEGEEAEEQPEATSENDQFEPETSPPDLGGTTASSCCRGFEEAACLCLDDDTGERNCGDDNDACDCQNDQQTNRPEGPSI